MSNILAEFNEIKQKANRSKTKMKRKGYTIDSRLIKIYLFHLQFDCRLSLDISISSSSSSSRSNNNKTKKKFFFSITNIEKMKRKKKIKREEFNILLLLFYIKREVLVLVLESK